MNDDMCKILNKHTVRFERVFPGPIDLVYDYLSKPEYLSKWLMEATVDAQVGGRIQFKSENSMPESLVADIVGGHELKLSKWKVCGLISQYDPPRLIAYSWNEVNYDMTSEVRFELAEKGDQVHLILTHSRLPAYLMASVGAGWHTHLEHVLALIKGETPADFYSRFNPLLQEYKLAIVAAGIIVASTSGSAALASPGDPAYESIKAARAELLTKYDRVWKEADSLKYKKDQLDRNISRDTSRAVDDLDKELNQTNDELHKIELDIRDLDKVLK